MREAGLAGLKPTCERVLYGLGSPVWPCAHGSEDPGRLPLEGLVEPLVVERVAVLPARVC